MIIINGDGISRSQSFEGCRGLAAFRRPRCAESAFACELVELSIRLATNSGPRCVCLSLSVCVFVCPRSYLRNYTQCTRSLGLGYKLCAVTPAAGQRTHGTTFRALKVTSQVATPGAESAVHDCLVIIGPHRSTRLDTIAGRGLFMPMFRGLSVCLLTSSAKWLSGSR